VFVTDLNVSEAFAVLEFEAGSNPFCHPLDSAIGKVAAEVDAFDRALACRRYDVAHQCCPEATSLPRPLYRERSLCRRAPGRIEGLQFRGTSHLPVDEAGKHGGVAAIDACRIVEDKAIGSSTAKPRPATLDFEPKQMLWKEVYVRGR